MDAQHKAALRLRALGGDEAALDELLNGLTAQKDAAIAQKDAAIAIAEQTVLSAIRTLGNLWSVHYHHDRTTSISMHRILNTHVQDGREDYGRGCRNIRYIWRHFPLKLLKSIGIHRNHHICV